MYVEWVGTDWLAGLRLNADDRHKARVTSLECWRFLITKDSDEKFRPKSTFIHHIVRLHFLISLPPPPTEDGGMEEMGYNITIMCPYFILYYKMSHTPPRVAGVQNGDVEDALCIVKGNLCLLSSVASCFCLITGFLSSGDDWWAVDGMIKV